MEFHEIANVFPLVQGPEYMSLWESIARSGLREPITLFEGKILDGRNRYRACQEVEVEPHYRTFEGTFDEAVSFVADTNLERRNLTPSQRAMISTELANLKRGRRPKSSLNGSPDPFKLDGSTDPSITIPQAAKLLKVSPSSVKRAKRVLEEGTPEQIEEVQQGTKTVNAAVKEIEQKKRNQVKASIITLREWEGEPLELRLSLAEAFSEGRSTMNRQSNTSIEWAQWSWNPVTGCKHNCVYCYARDIANRFYPHGFEPAFIPERLHQPSRTKVPRIAPDAIGWDAIAPKNIFACSMADLFGKWVPQPWIDDILEEIHGNPQWNFLCLTKFPQRLSEQNWPKNAWVGATVDTQSRVALTMKAFSKPSNASVRWLSLEPLLEPLEFDSLEMFDMIVIGGSSASSKTPAWNPPYQWYESLLYQARKDGVAVYMKDNMVYRPREFPGTNPQIATLPRAFGSKP